MNRIGADKKRAAAFTLIELMIALAIIGLLAGLALPRFAGLLNKSKESSTRDSLSALRSAISIYYGTHTFYPSDDLTCLTEEGRYINQIPLAKLPGTIHPDTQAISVGASTAAAVTDAGGWAYINDPDSPLFGTLTVNCSHSDLSGKNWNLQ